MLSAKRAFNLIRFQANPNLTKLKYSVTSTSDPLQIDLKLSSLKSHLNTTHKISESLFTSTVKLIETNKSCNSEIALTLIKSCGINFVDLFPVKRQKWLNFLFNDLFRSLNVKYDQEHYNHYMLNTISNQAEFDPFKISNQMKNENVLANLSINNCFMKQLCDLDQIKIALFHLKILLQSQTSNLVDLEQYKQNPLFDSEKFYDDFIREVRDLKLENNQYAGLFSPVIDYFFRLNDTNKVLELVNLMTEINVQPSNSTNLSLINGYLNTTNFDKAKHLLEKSEKNLDLNDILNLYQTNVLLKSSSNKKNKFSEILIEKLKSFDFDQSNRILLVNSIMKLGMNKKHDDSLILLRSLFSAELNEQDPIKKDLINQNLNIKDYFFKTLVEFEDSADRLIKYSKIEGDVSENLKSITHHSLLKQNTECSLKLLKEIKSLNNPNARVKACYFYPLLVKESMLLENSLNENSIKSKSKFKLEKQINYKRIESLLKMIRFDFNALFTIDDLEVVLSLLKFNADNEPKQFLKYVDLARIFDRNKIFKTSTLFNACAFKILNYRLEYLRKNRDKPNFNLQMNQIKEDFNEIHNLITELNISLFNEPILIKLNQYLTKLYQTNMVYEDPNNIEENIVFKTIRLLNDKLQYDKSATLNEINENFLNYSLKINDKSSETKIRKLFDQSFHGLKTKKVNRFIINEDYADKTETIEDLMNLIVELETKNKDAYPAMRRLLINLCNSSRDEISNPIDFINKYEQRIPNAELTPLVCQDLMWFYTKNTFNNEKSKFYFYKLTEHCTKDSFDADSRKILAFIESLPKSKNTLETIRDVFTKLKWSQANDDLSSLNKLGFILSDWVFRSSTSNEFCELVEKIFESNFVSRHASISNLVMIKFIELYKLDDAFEYFKMNLAKHKMSVLEIIIVQSYLKKYENQLLKGTKLEELLQYFSKFYAPNLAYNFLFYAHILNGDFYSANIIYERNLNKQLDLNVLKRLISQFNDSSKLFKNHSRNLINIKDFKPINEDLSLKSNIRKILNKLL